MAGMPCLIYQLISVYSKYSHEVRRDTFVKIMDPTQEHTVITAWPDTLSYLLFI